MNISKSEISYPNSIVNGHAVATATRNSQYGSLRSNKQPAAYQYQDQYDSYAHADGRSHQSANMASVRYDNSYGPDSETDSEDEIEKMKRQAMERAQGQGSTSESDLEERGDEGDQMIPRMRQEEILRTAENDLDVLREMQAEYNRRNPFQESVII